MADLPTLTLDYKFDYNYQGSILTIRAVYVDGTTRVFCGDHEVFPDGEFGTSDSEYIYHLALKALIMIVAAEMVDPRLQELVGDVLATVELGD